jgi:hypothetical protein
MYTYSLAVFSDPFVAHNSIDFGKDREVAPYTNIHTRVDAGTKLTHDDIPCSGELACVDFHSTPLSWTVSTVSRRSLSFFMGHGSSSYVYSYHSDSGKMLPVSVSPTVIFPPLLFEHQNFFLFPMLDNGGRNSCPRYNWGTNTDRSFRRGQQYLRESDLASNFVRQGLYSKELSR